MHAVYQCNDTYGNLLSLPTLSLTIVGDYYNKKAVLSLGNRAMPQLFGLKFADNIHYKFKSSQASKARLHSLKCTGAKKNLTQNSHSRPLKVVCFGVSGKAIKDTK